MSRIDITTSAAPLSDGMLQTANPLDATLQVVTDNVGNSSTVSLSTTETQINSILRIKTDNAELLDIENSSGNRFNINRDVQKVNLDFASNPTGSTSIVGAIRTFVDGVNLSNVLTFLENGSIYNNGGGSILSNTAFGESALIINTTGADNSAFGLSSLSSNITGSSNTAFGHEALFANTSSFNTAIGKHALRSNTTGSTNTAVGHQAAYSNTTGSMTAIGYLALFGNTTGLQNTAVGNRSQTASGMTGSANTSIGERSLQSVTTGSSNNAVGFESLKLNTTGSFNIAIGEVALRANTTGSLNTAVGYNTQSGNFSNSVILGANAVSTANNQFVVGSVSTNAGLVSSEVNVSSKVWNVIINGVAQKILLA